MQGKLFTLLQAESENITWNFDLPRRVLKFAVNSSIDTLPTYTNLRRWGKRASVNFHGKADAIPCSRPLKHKSDQGRITWRHSSILNHIAGCLKSALVGKSTVERDLEGLHEPGWREHLGAGTETRSVILVLVCLLGLFTINIPRISHLDQGYSMPTMHRPVKNDKGLPLSLHPGKRKGIGCCYFVLFY
jgi:hypothetical protein